MDKALGHWWGEKSGAKRQTETGKGKHEMCRHSLGRRNLVQTLFKALDRLFGMVAPKKDCEVASSRTAP